MERTRVKICGITRPEDGRSAADLGADAVGLVFYAGSPRAVTIPQARAVVAALPPFVTAVGLFVDAGRAAVEAVLREVPLGLLQFHGEEAADDCAAFGCPYIKAVRVRGAEDIRAAAERHPRAAGLLLDAFEPGQRGGTGRRFDWGLIPGEFDRPLILAGGLDAGNVREALARVRPYAVDVSSGVEAAKGVKDWDKMRAFMAAVREYERQAG